MSTTTSLAARLRPSALPPSVVRALAEHTTDHTLDVLFLGPFVAGDQPIARTRRLDRVLLDAPLLPAGGWEVRRVTSERAVRRLVCGDGWSLLTVCRSNRTAFLSVTATTDDLAAAVLDGAALDAVEPPAPDETIDIGFWSLGQYGPGRVGKRIAAPAWRDVARNYTAPVRDALDTLASLGAEQVTGRLLLLHGPPGTGKTSALRALARSWASWCAMEYVLDPEHLLGNAQYLVEAAGEGDDDDEGRQWRLLVLEDCDELIAADAKSSSGQALARLLNLTDGILGQGLGVIVAITTNEPLHRLHPAVTRPGRCLAQIEVGPLTAIEARDWLGPDVTPPGGGATLAALYALLDRREPVEVERPGPDVAGYL